MREVCTADLLANPVVTGGPNTTVKVDESLLTQKKKSAGAFYRNSGSLVGFVGKCITFQTEAPQRRRR